MVAFRLRTYVVIRGKFIEFVWIFIIVVIIVLEHHI